jgi:hypothetical protein
MKKKLTLTGIAAVIVAVIMGCSGDGTTAGTGYAGTVTPGDFVHFSLSGDTISYRVEGDVFGEVTGDVTVEELGTGGYVYKGTVNGKTAYFFMAENLGIAAIPIEGETYIGVGLKETQGGLTSDHIVGTYAYGEVGFDTTTHKPNDVDGCEIEVKADSTAEVSCISGSNETGGWKISDDGTYVLYKEDTAASAITDSNADARVVVRPSEDGDGHKGFLVDIAGGGGFGIGLEEKTMTQDSVKGNYLVVDYKHRELIDVVVTPDGTDPTLLTYATSVGLSLSQGKGLACHTQGGAIRINNDCTGYRKGIACVQDYDGNQYVGALDNIEGYFALVTHDNFIVGVKKP